MEKLYDWIRQIAYVMVIVSVIMQLAAGKQYQKYIRLYTGIILILFMLAPVLQIFGTDRADFMKQAEAKYTEMAERIETKAAELEREADVTGDSEETESGQGINVQADPSEKSEDGQTESGRIEVGEIRIGR